MTITRTRMSLLTALLSLPVINTAQANCVPEPYIGSVCMTAATFCPRGFAEANGQLLAISSNSALFSLLGTNYGGDGRTTFGLPDLRGRTPVGIGTGPGLQNIRQGAMPGREFITLNILNLPSHTHSATVSSPVTVNVSIPVVPNSGSNVTTPSDSQNYLAASPGGPNAAAIWAAKNTETVAQVGGVSASGAVTGAVTVGNTGGSQSFESRPPQTGMRYCVALVGVFPPRD
ncbi:microcystin dependent protein [Bacterioplanes sanyensis]|uniref:phage tail protein n=1 Tax=Bacterioplanes sanyensis TaxID=1249553 RepID=UPI001986B018|nr:tail fiber protein [Bacterioplanes sanyensis]GGY37177.1 microcystin dependent protein [Bacterioplanes sanyensis]